MAGRPLYNLPNATTVESGDKFLIQQGVSSKQVDKDVLLTAENTSWQVGKSVGYVLDDYRGVKDELYSQAGITDDGSQNQLGDSQVFNALATIFDRRFDNVAAMGAATSIMVGQNLKWDGYYVRGDGGGGRGIVKSGTHVPDGGSIFSIDSNTYVEVYMTEIVGSLQFGIKHDNSDETTRFEKWLDYCLSTGKIADGKSRPVRTTLNKTYSPTKNVRLHELSIIAGNNYTDQPVIVIDGDVNYEVINLVIDGERHTRPSGTETWQVFSTEQGVSSITPVSAAVLSIGRLSKCRIKVNGVDCRNLVADAGLVYFSISDVVVSNLHFENCANKTFHGWHGVDGGSQPDTGVTHLDGYTAYNCGIMPSSFLVGGVPKLRSDNYAPQGSFGCIVSFGNFNHSNVYVKNYGSTGVTPDRNISANGNNIIIKHDDINAFSNNPSGAYWNELCKSCNVTNMDISVSARDPRETITENSLIQVYPDVGGDCQMTNIKLETSAAANMSKDIRCSMQSGSSFRIDGYDLESNASVESVSALQVAGLSKSIILGRGRIRGAPLRITQAQHTVMDNLDCDQEVLVNTSLPNPFGAVDFTKSTCSSLTINGSTGDINIDGGAILGGLSVQSSGGGKFSLDGGTVIGGLTFVSGVKSANVGNIETARRVEFGDIERVKVVGPTLKTDAGEPILWFNPVTAGFMKAATAMSVTTIIKTGTVGAAGIVFNSNVVTTVDIGNSNLTLDWT